MAKKQKASKKIVVNTETDRLRTMIELTKRAMEGQQGDTLIGFEGQLKRLEDRIKESK